MDCSPDVLKMWEKSGAWAEKTECLKVISGLIVKYQGLALECCLDSTRDREQLYGAQVEALEKAADAIATKPALAARAVKQSPASLYLENVDGQHSHFTE